MSEHWDTRLPLHMLDQRLTATRDNEVKQSSRGKHCGYVGSVGGWCDLHRRIRHLRAAQTMDER
jgi:hypothetical protein